MNRYHAILFDLDHTLVDTRKQYALGLQLAIRELYGDDAPSGLAERITQHSDALWPRYDRREITMQDLRRERFVRAWKDFGVVKTPEEADAFHEVYAATFDQTVFVFPGTHELLRELARDYRLAIVTNGAPDLQWRKTRIAGLDEFFSEQTLIISEQIGHAKPHPAVFQAACDAVAAPPHAVVMVGDNYEADYLGARAFGMDAVWYTPDPLSIPAELEDLAAAPIRTSEQLLCRIRELEQARLV